MQGISSSEQILQSAFPGRMRPTVHYFALAVDAEPATTAAKLESTFLTNGLEAESIHDVVDDAVAANMTFNKLVQGFLGLGPLVGVAALGRHQRSRRRRAASADRRRESDLLPDEDGAGGVHRPDLDPHRNHPSAPARLEHHPRHTRSQPSGENLELVVPWVNLGVIFLVVYAVALAATFAPGDSGLPDQARRALRYQ
jgi:putative ABC transport system permease protein